MPHEKSARRNLLAQDREKIEDLAWRSFATLKSAHIISSQETISLLSAVRLGADLGIIKGLNPRLVNELLILTQPAHLQKREGKAISPAQRDIKRAEIIRERLKNT
jgi:protein arginine kinase